MDENYKFEVGQKVWVTEPFRMVHGAKAFIVSDRAFIPAGEGSSSLTAYWHSNIGGWINECYLYIEEEGIDSEAIFHESLKDIRRGL